MVVYQRVHDEILQALKDNVYPVGTLLPPEPELERIYSVSRTTVRRAIAKLSEEGYVQVRQGYGTMVLKNIYPSETFEFSRLHHFENTLSIRHVNVPNPEKMSARGMYINTVPADKVVSEALQVKLNTPVFRVQRIFYSGETPLMFFKQLCSHGFFSGIRSTHRAVLGLISFSGPQL